MALRPARVYRPWKRSYSRVAPSTPRKGYVKGVPGSKLHLFEMGNSKGSFDLKLSIVSQGQVQIRHNALEAGRIAAANYLRKHIEEKNFFLKVRVFPHQVMREHAQAAIAQADRFYDGMSHPFGKPSGTAARVKIGQSIITACVNKENIVVAKEALRRAAAKMPVHCRIIDEAQS